MLCCFYTTCNGTHTFQNFCLISLISAKYFLKSLGVIKMFSGKSEWILYVPFAQQWVLSWNSVIQVIFALSYGGVNPDWGKWACSSSDVVTWSVITWLIWWAIDSWESSPLFRVFNIYWQWLEICGSPMCHFVQVLFWEEGSGQSDSDRVRVVSTTARLSGLRGSAVYLISVRAQNSAGLGPCSPALNITTKKPRESAHTIVIYFLFCSTIYLKLQYATFSNITDLINLIRFKSNNLSLLKWLWSWSITITALI